MSTSNTLNRVRGQSVGTKPSFVPKALIGLDRSTLGTVDRFEVKDGILKMEGWALSDALMLHTPSRDIEIDDRFARDDVAEVAGAAQAKTAGFAVMTDWDGGDLRLSVDTGSKIYIFEIIDQ